MKKYLLFFSFSFFIVISLNAQNYTHTNKSRITVLEFSPSGKYLISGANDNYVIVWDVEQGRGIRKFYSKNDAIASFQVFPDESKIIICDIYNWIIIHDFNTGEIITRIEDVHYRNKDYKSYFATTPDSKNIVMSEGSRYYEYGRLSFRTNLGVLIHEFDSVKRSYYKINFGNDNRMLASIEHKQDIVRIWDANAGKLLAAYEGLHKDEITDVKLLHDNQWFMTSSEDGTAKLWSVKTGKLLKTFDLKTYFFQEKDLEVLGISISSNESSVSLNFRDNGDDEIREFGVVTYDIATGNPVHYFSKDIFVSFCTALSPDGKYLTISETSKGKIKFFDPNTGLEVINDIWK